MEADGILGIELRRITKHVAEGLERGFDVCQAFPTDDLTW